MPIGDDVRKSWRASRYTELSLIGDWLSLSNSRYSHCQDSWFYNLLAKVRVLREEILHGFVPRDEKGTEVFRKFLTTVLSFDRDRRWALTATHVKFSANYCRSNRNLYKNSQPAWEECVCAPVNKACNFRCKVDVHEKYSFRSKWQRDHLGWFSKSLIHPYFFRHQLMSDSLAPWCCAVRGAVMSRRSGWRRSRPYKKKFFKSFLTKITTTVTSFVLDGALLIL